MAKKTLMEAIETFVMGDAAPHEQKAKSSKRVKKKVAKKAKTKSIKKPRAKKAKTTKKKR